MSRLWQWLVCTWLGHKKYAAPGERRFVITHYGAFYQCARCPLLIESYDNFPIKYRTKGRGSYSEGTIKKTDIGSLIQFAGRDR